VYKVKLLCGSAKSLPLILHYFISTELYFEIEVNQVFRNQKSTLCIFHSLQKKRKKFNVVIDDYAYVKLPFIEEQHGFYK
jgi:hypothetical protein